MAKIHIKTITKEEAREATLKANRAARRLETMHLKPQTFEDKRTKRNRTRSRKNKQAIKESSGE